ncbi:hypothetical protein ACHAW5_008198 [Stephanodiscus triporus]|uniref:Condensin complex subunit 2 n=1 Tax=Stephanodiscus triporus TaxID=2934178 RepID=A0ABD3MVH7_9STRA
MPLAARSTAAAGSIVTTAVVTPIIDEFEQAPFYASCDGGGGDHVFRQPQVSSFHAITCHEAERQQQRCVSSLESMIDTALPCSSFYSVAADENLNTYVDQDHGHVPPPAEVSDFYPQEIDRQVSTNNAGDVMRAAGILCHFKNDCSAQGAADIVDMAAKMLTDENQQDSINDSIMENQLFRNLPLKLATAAVSFDTAIDSLVHPNHLATDDDAEEVNKLHQYVRKELLEIFVVPHQAAASDCDDDEDEEDTDEDEDGSCVNDTPKYDMHRTKRALPLATWSRDADPSPSPPPPC